MKYLFLFLIVLKVNLFAGLYGVPIIPYDNPEEFRDNQRKPISGEKIYMNFKSLAETTQADSERIQNLSDTISTVYIEMSDFKKNISDTMIELKLDINDTLTQFTNDMNNYKSSIDAEIINIKNDINDTVNLLNNLSDSIFTNIDKIDSLLLLADSITKLNNEINQYMYLEKNIFAETDSNKFDINMDNSFLVYYDTLAYLIKGTYYNFSIKFKLPQELNLDSIDSILFSIYFEGYTTDDPLENIPPNITDVVDTPILLLKIHTNISHQAYITSDFVFYERSKYYNFYIPTSILKQYLYNDSTFFISSDYVGPSGEYYIFSSRLSENPPKITYYEKEKILLSDLNNSINELSDTLYQNYQPKGDYLTQTDSVNIINYIEQSSLLTETTHSKIQYLKTNDYYTITQHFLKDYNYTGLFERSFNGVLDSSNSPIPDTADFAIIEIFRHVYISRNSGSDFTMEYDYVNVGASEYASCDFKHEPYNFKVPFFNDSYRDFYRSTIIVQLKTSYVTNLKTLLFNTHTKIMVHTPQYIYFFDNHRIIGWGWY